VNAGDFKGHRKLAEACDDNFKLGVVLYDGGRLILGTATTAKKAPLPDPLYVYCTKMLFALEPNSHHMAATVSHRFSGMDRKST
jgi:hypothetical protein